MTEPMGFINSERGQLDEAINHLKGEAETFAYDEDAVELANMGLLFSGAP